MLKAAAALALAGAFAAAGTAQAASYLVTVGGRIRVSPPYEGSKDYRLVPIGLLSIRKVGSLYRFTPPDSSGTFALFDRKYIVLGPTLRLRDNRPDTGKFVGLDKIGVAIEPGVFMDLWPTNWLRGHIEGRRGVSGHAGFVGDAGIDLIYTGKKWDGSIGPRIGFGDAKYMRTYFGVSPLEAARNPSIASAYDPAGGRRYAGGAAAIAYHLTDRWRTIFDISYNKLGEIPRDSPVVRRLGSSNQFSAGVGVTYTFGHVGA